MASRYDRARWLASRATQIVAGDAPRVAVPKGMIDPIEIARLELVDADTAAAEAMATTGPKMWPVTRKERTRPDPRSTRARGMSVFSATLPCEASPDRLFFVPIGESAASALRRGATLVQVHTPGHRRSATVCVKSIDIDAGAASVSGTVVRYATGCASCRRSLVFYGNDGRSYMSCPVFNGCDAPVGALVGAVAVDAPVDEARAMAKTVDAHPRQSEASARA